MIFSPRTVQCGFNPFFIRASVYCAADTPRQGAASIVSIPSSSGHQFTEGEDGIVSQVLKAFQSLLHQGISLLSFLSIPSHSGIKFMVSIPSSSGHQFTGINGTDFNPDFRAVSIPSSSGHQFTARRRIRPGPATRPCFNPFFIRASVYCAKDRGRAWIGPPLFQSLLHQGISLLASSDGECPPYPSRGFNPFFIRASVYWLDRACAEIRTVHRFNPFFIRASVYCFLYPGGEVPESLLFQSLLHQGISLLVLQKLVEEVGEVVFQSLLHQGISLLGTSCALLSSRYRTPFQSLLHQGISLLDSANAHCWRHPEKPFQSLLHQGISLLGRSRRT